MEQDSRLLQGGELPEPSYYTITVHCIILTIAWTGAANLATLLVMFNHSPKTIYLHMLLMWGVAIVSFAGPLLLIVPRGFII